VTSLLLALLTAYGVHLVYTAFAFRWRGVGPGPSVTRRRSASQQVHEWLVQAGFADTRPIELASVIGLLTAVGAGIGWAVFGGVLPPLAVGIAVGAAPLLGARARRERRRALAREAWPRLIEEIRIMTTTLGRSIPQALFDVGRRAPEEMRPAFDMARREWLLSTDFDRTLDVLRARLADATADTVCETLLVAQEIGGNDVDRCLVALADDRIMDLQGRKDAASRQAGARFARSFTLVVPLGMALIGMSIGEGRRAYASSTGQLLVLVAIALMALCWTWAGRIMRLPDEQRVFLGTDAERA
jgi:tight adherence protein B